MRDGSFGAAVPASAVHFSCWSPFPQAASPPHPAAILMPSPARGRREGWLGVWLPLSGEQSAGLRVLLVRPYTCGWLANLFAFFLFCSGGAACFLLVLSVYSLTYLSLLHLYLRAVRAMSSSCLFLHRQ